MCIMSMVHDHYRDRFPMWPDAIPPHTDPPAGVPFTLPPAVDLAELRRLVDEFKAAVEAAGKLDALLKQPDCLDPEKAKTAERVARLERIIDALLVERAKA